MKLKRLATSLLPAVLATLLAGCASLGSPSPEAEVMKRADARWAALVKRDMPAAYGFLPPSTRAVLSQERYAGRFGSTVGWRGAEALSATCSPQPAPVRCLVNVRIQAAPVLGYKLGPGLSTDLQETWILEDGQWWLFQKI